MQYIELGFDLYYAGRVWIDNNDVGRSTAYAIDNVVLGTFAFGIRLVTDSFSRKVF